MQHPQKPAAPAEKFETLTSLIYLELRLTNRPQFFIVYKLNDQRNDVNNV